jgi:hypothetical protein
LAKVAKVANISGTGRGAIYTSVPSTGGEGKAEEERLEWGQRAAIVGQHSSGEGVHDNRR